MSTDQDLRRQGAGGWETGRNLLPRPLDSVSLYVHIPFCQSRCRYCNFYFETGWSPAILQRSLDRLLDESRAFRGWLFADRPAKVHTVYFGGGTPSVIPPAILDPFLAGFRAIWNLDGHAPREFAFEANPESFGPDLLSVLARHGVDRISLGVQSFDSEALRSLGRRAETAQVEAALRCLSEARSGGRWRGRFNLDLIAGIPGQSLADSAGDVRRALEWQPDHVSLYSLTEEPGTPLAQLYAAGRRQRPAEELVEAQVEQAAAMLEAGGLHNYEISNFARPGAESLHNLAYWELRPYVGLGPGAVGTLPVNLSEAPPSQTGPRPAIARLTNPVSMAYSRPNQSAWQHLAEILSPGDFLVDHFVVGLRTERGLDLSRLEGIFHLPSGCLVRCLADLSAEWEAAGWLAKPPGGHAETRLALSASGRSLLNSRLVELMAALENYSAVQSGLAGLDCPDWPISLAPGSGQTYTLGDER
jgi:oxygen-independent coproporphyrinogen-3 oxidase